MSNSLQAAPSPGSAISPGAAFGPGRRRRLPKLVALTCVALLIGCEGASPTGEGGTQGGAGSAVC